MSKISCGGFEFDDKTMEFNENKELTFKQGASGITKITADEWDGRFRVWEYDAGVYYVESPTGMFFITAREGTGENVQEKTATAFMANQLVFLVNVKKAAKISEWTCSNLVNGTNIIQKYDPVTDTWSYQVATGITSRIPWPSTQGTAGQVLSFVRNGTVEWADKDVFWVVATENDSGVVVDKTFEEIVSALNGGHTLFLKYFSGDTNMTILPLIFTDFSDSVYFCAMQGGFVVECEITSDGNITGTEYGCLLFNPRDGGALINNLILSSSTGSGKKFIITVDDSGAITATEV